ncbi:amidohydrolase family protein [Kitasatospora fiedleri]|uniref:amidohydrolase family protein n=1 Tax=Kitasatospora fiedleri TaxID=2991545 RepID=UPI00249A2A6E|nr:amidohydrolase family protein [Kitasatospora fiedleri]
MIRLATAPELVRDVNDPLAAAGERHPGRFAAFASLPTTAPERAPDELRRAVRELGRVGALIHGRTGGGFLSAECFDPILRTAAGLRVPIYPHPARRLGTGGPVGARRVRHLGARSAVASAVPGRGIDQRVG